MELRQHFLDTSDVRLNYAENDRPGSVVVLLHGLTLRWQAMESLIGPLSRQHHVFACDLRGHGKSSHSSSGYPLTGYIDDMVNLIMERVREKAVVVGASLSGLVALGVAAALPEMTRGVLAIDPPMIIRDSPYEATSYSEAYDWIKMVHEAVTADEAVIDTARRLQALYPETPDQDAWEWAQATRTMDPSAIEYLMDGRLLDGFDLAEALRRIQCRAVLLAGEVELGGLVRDTDIDFFTARTQDGAAIRLTGAAHGLDAGFATPALDQIASLLAFNR
jgi:pimeloyl-ACP methyl ester carboxylesterase